VSANEHETQCHVKEPECSKNENIQPEVTEVKSCINSFFIYTSTYLKTLECHRLQRNTLALTIPTNNQENIPIISCIVC